MEVTIERSEHKPLLKRTEITARIFYQGATPSRLDVLAAVAKKANVKKDTLVIQRIHTTFGETAAHVEAISYADADTMRRLERENLLAKHADKPAKKAEQDTPTPSKDRPADTKGKDAEESDQDQAPAADEDQESDEQAEASEDEQADKKDSA